MCLNCFDFAVCNNLIGRVIAEKLTYKQVPVYLTRSTTDDFVQPSLKTVRKKLNKMIKKVELTEVD